MCYRLYKNRLPKRQPNKDKLLYFSKIIPNFPEYETNGENCRQAASDK